MHHKGSSTCQHKDLRFGESAVPRTDRESRFWTCYEGLVPCSHVSGSIVEGDWLCYSRNQGKVYCVCYKLFGTGQNSFITGFKDWKHASVYIGSHERSPNYSSSIKTFLQISTKKHRLDAVTWIFERKFKYMKNVLNRVVNVITFFATRNLAFRGSEKKIVSQTNGNYLGIIELISLYDPFLVEHFIKRGNLYIWLENRFFDLL